VSAEGETGTVEPWERLSPAIQYQIVNGLRWPALLWNYQRLTASTPGSGQFRGEFSVRSCHRLI